MILGLRPSKSSLALILAFLIAPLVAEAQVSRKAYRIGALAIAGPTDTPPPPAENWEGFLQGLRERGYIEGRNVAFELRSAGGRPERFTGLAADLVRLNVDVIFARGSDATRAAQNATKLRAIPIVAIDLESDPVAAGFVASLAKPGGNLTGTFLDLAELSGKHVQILTEIIPGLSRIAVLGHPVVNAAQLTAVTAAAATRKLHIETLELRDRKDVDIAIASASSAGTGALIVLSSPLSVLHRARIAELASRYRLPAMYVYRPHVEAGGLISYGPNLADMFRQCGVYVGRILDGAKPADLPIERPTKFELVINANAAKALVLTVPPSLLVRADHVIQ